MKYSILYLISILLNLYMLVVSVEKQLLPFIIATFVCLIVQFSIVLKVLALWSQMDCEN